MEPFEGIVKTALELEGYWVRQSFKVNLTKEEKREIGKHSLPRPEIDLLAFKPGQNRVLAIEVKSYFDSPGVTFHDLEKIHAVPEGRHKLLTCASYKKIVFQRQALDLQAVGLANPTTSIELGLVLGNVKKADEARIQAFLVSSKIFYWSPQDVKKKIMSFATLGYENDPAIIAAKALLR